MEQQKLELLMRARQNARARGAWTGEELATMRSCQQPVAWNQLSHCDPATCICRHRSRALRSPSPRRSCRRRRSSPSRTPTRFQAKLAQIEKNCRDAAQGHRRAVHAGQRRRGQLLPQVPRRQPGPGRDRRTRCCTAPGNGRVTGRAIVDLDAVRTQKKRALDRSARLPDGTACRSRRPARSRRERRRTVPAGIGARSPASRSRSRCCRNFSATTRRTPENPDGINMDEPFALPSAIREIRIGQGTAVDRPVTNARRWIRFRDRCSI